MQSATVSSSSSRVTPRPGPFPIDVDLAAERSYNRCRPPRLQGDLFDGLRWNMSTWVNVRLPITRFFGKTRTIVISGLCRHNFTRTSLLVLLATIGLLGPVSAARGAGEPPADGQSLLARAAAQLAAAPSLEAKLRQQVLLFGQELSGSGTYLQKQAPQGLLLRLELKLQVGSQLSSLQQVCDGRFLWIRRDLPGGSSLGRVDMARIQTAIRERGRPPWTDITTNWLAVGGLPRVVAALGENFQFSAPRAVRSEKAVMWLLDGRWNPDKLAELQPDRKGKTEDLTQLPAHLPTQVRVVLGQNDLLPYRIEYRRQPAEPAADDNATARPLVLLEIVELHQRENLDERLFVYQPGNQEVTDYTDLYLDSLKVAPQGERKPD